MVSKLYILDVVYAKLENQRNKGLFSKKLS